MRSDGSRVRRVTAGPFDFDPAWSPDGDSLVFAPYSETGGLSLVDLTGEYLPWKNHEGDGDEYVSDRSPTWSPDGEWVCFSRYTETETALYLVRPGGGALRKLVDGDQPDWDPNGRVLAFDHDGDIYAIDVASGGVTRLTRTKAVESDPAWSPDGTLVVYSRTESSREKSPSSVWVMTAQGENQKPLAEKAAEPDWQPLPR
jgi:TolB protein